MKRSFLVTGFLLACFLSVPQARADVGSGFGLFGGFASHTSEVAFPGLPFEFESSGSAIGIDWQFDLGENFSINPFLMSSSETVSGDVEGTAGHGILGVSFRFWFGGLFLGPHIGSYSQVVQLDSLLGVPVSGDVNSSGTGAGFAVGWQSENGFFLMFQTDRATVEDSGGVETDLSGTRLQFGFRWKK